MNSFAFQTDFRIFIVVKKQIISGMDNQIIIYQTEDGQTRVDVRMENETVWLTANQMAMLFERDEKTIRKHINNVFSEGELERDNNTHFCVLME